MASAYSHSAQWGASVRDRVIWDEDMTEQCTTHMAMNGGVRTWRGSIALSIMRLISMITLPSLLRY